MSVEQTPLHELQAGVQYSGLGVCSSSDCDVFISKHH